MPTRDDSQLAHPVHQDKDVKGKTTYKSTSILRNKSQLAISRARCASLKWTLFTKKNDQNYS